MRFWINEQEELLDENSIQFYDQISTTAAAGLNARAKALAKNPRKGTKLRNWLMGLRADQRKLVETSWDPFVAETSVFRDDPILTVSTTPTEALWLGEQQPVEEQVGEEMQKALTDRRDSWMQIMLADLFDPNGNHRLKSNE